MNGQMLLAIDTATNLAGIALLNALQTNGAPAFAADGAGDRSGHDAADSSAGASGGRSGHDTHASRSGTDAAASSAGASGKSAPDAAASDAEAHGSRDGPDAVASGAEEHGSRSSPDAAASDAEAHGSRSSPDAAASGAQAHGSRSGRYNAASRAEAYSGTRGQAAAPRADEPVVLAALQWQTGRNHTVELMPNILRLLAEAGARAEQLDAVVVAIGPGSYTGLRIGLSVAKGFCMAHGAALLAVPTLDISALGSAPRDGLLCAILQAGRGRLAAGFYRVEQGVWQRSGELFFGRAADLAEACAGQPVYFAGELDDETAAVLRARLADQAAFAPDGARARDPRVLARLGWERLRLGLRENLETLAPAYGQ